MTWLVREFAGALLAGPWERRPMIARLAYVTNLPEAGWIVKLVAAVLRKHGEPPDHEALTDWLYSHRPLQRVLVDPEIRIRRWLEPPLEMADSPWDVPPLGSRKELATWLGLDVQRLEALADERGRVREAREQRMRHYRYTWIAKRAGGHRLLEAPKPRLRAVQRLVLDDIVAKVPPHDAAHGFRAGHSVVGFAAVHVGREVVIRVDLHAFFASVSRPRVAAIFRSAGYPREIAGVLAALCTHRTPRDVLAAAPSREWSELAKLRGAHLPQGAPTSGALANLAAYRLDVRVAALAAAIGASYTRYADDLVLSGPRALARAASSIVGRIGAIAHDEGFALNFRKTRVMTASDRQRITGLVVNEKLAVTRDEVDRLRAILFNCARTGPAAQNREGHADFRAHLLGRISWVSAVDRGKGDRLRALFDRIRWDEAPADATDEDVR
ncbi:MAG: RNA-directed DNA polymerase [Kofleriaceae bacterium]|nr:RNA-directed DNA polymerase [Kofleriaceae bacterium]